MTSEPLCKVLEKDFRNKFNENRYNLILKMINELYEFKDFEKIKSLTNFANVKENSITSRRSQAVDLLDMYDSDIFELFGVRVHSENLIDDEHYFIWVIQKLLSKINYTMKSRVSRGIRYYTISAKLY